VTFAVTSGPAVIGPLNLLSFTGAGSVTITASQAGNGTYSPAADVSRTFNVTKASATVSLAPLAQTYTGTARTVTATTNPPSLPVTITYNGLSTVPTDTGSYAVVGTINSPMYQGSASGTLVVSKATATVTLSSLAQVYNGSPRAVGVATVPGGLSYSLTYNNLPSAPVNAGSYAVEVIINAPNHVGTATGTLVVSQAPQTISFPALANTVATASVTLGATGGASGNPVTYAVTEGPGQISGGNQLTFTGAGLVRVVASQAGNGNFLAATSVERTVNVSKATAQILLSGLNSVYNGSPQGAGIATVPAGLGYSVTYGGSPTVPTAAGTYPVVVTISDPLYQGTVTGDLVIQKAVAQITLSGLTVTYSGLPQGAAAVTDPVGVPVVFAYDGLPGLPVVAGSYSVVATIDHPSIEGSASGTFLIEKAPQAIIFDTISDRFATETVVLTATGGGSVNPVLFEVVEGSATISGGNLLTFSSEGTVSVRASQAGDANHLDADTVTRSFDVTKFPATVTLLNLTQSYTGAPRPVGYSTSPENLNVALSYGVENYGDLSGAPVVPGTYLVLAVIDEPYYRGDAGGFLTITKGVQTITFPAIPPQVATATVTLGATGGPSGNPVTFEIADGPGEIDGNQLTFTASGTVTVRARQAGNTLYDAATPMLQSITVNKAAASVEIFNLTRTYDGLPQTPSATTSPPGLSVSYTYDGGSAAPTGAGSYAVIASISDPRYAGSDTETFVVGKATQAIDFPPLANALANVSVPLSATGGGSGLPVTFEVTDGPASVQGGNSLVFSGAGEVTVTALQASDTNHFAAPPVARTLTVSKAPAPSLALSALHQVFDGSPREIVVLSVPPGLASLVTYDGDPDAPTGTGSYEVIATLDDPIYEGSVAGILVVDDPNRLDLVPGGNLPALSALGSIDVPTFAMGRYEVTWGLWKQVRDWANLHGYDLALSGAGCADDHPVRGISWFEAVKWCNARTEWENVTLGTTYETAYRQSGSVYRTGQPATAAEIAVLPGTSGYRLPDGPEREYAARGGRLSTGQPYPGGANATDLAWHAANSGGATCDLAGGRGTRPVGALLANELGLYDLAGNVGEWSGGALSAAPAQRLVFGGDWDAAAAALLHTALGEAAPADRSDRIGFRVARSVATALANALDNDQIPWDSGDAQPWHAQTGDKSDGIDAASIGALGGVEAGWVETTVTGPGNIAFSWKIQLPTGIGALLVAIDGEERARITGATAWAGQSVYVPPGTHVIRWTYQRSLAQGIAPDPLPGANGAWLDAVAFTEAVAPTVTTGAITALGEEGGTGAGIVTADGGSPIEGRGMVVSIESQPLIGEDLVFAAAAAVTGPFEITFTALIPGTTYRARAYATNAAGTGYGSEIVFTTDESVDLAGGTANRQREIVSGDRHVFHFTLSSPRHASFSTVGGAALRAELFNGNGDLIATFSGDADLDLGELLYAGDYELHVYRTADGGATQSYNLTFDVATEAVSRPDAAVGSSLPAQTGVGIYGSSAGQTLSLGSRNAVPVSGVATFRNGGTLPDELILSGSGGSALFAVSYLGESGNVTAQMLTGTLRTAALVEGDEPFSVTVSVVPNRKKLSEKKGKKNKIVTLKRTHALSIRAKSDFDPSLEDEAVIIVRTF
jgi:formylglycine-generating enzyme required for sulfatase activity